MKNKNRLRYDFKHIFHQKQPEYFLQLYTFKQNYSVANPRPIDLDDLLIFTEKPIQSSLKMTQIFVLTTRFHIAIY